MIVILHERRHTSTAIEMQLALEREFPGMPVLPLDGANADHWPAVETWSDVLVVPFDDAPLLPKAEAFVRVQLARKVTPFVLPVALDSSHRVPPIPLDAIKALPYENDGFRSGCRRIGAKLGLCIRSRDHKIFISYRAIDGTSVATQLEDFLKSEGYNVWRDDAKDTFDGQTMIPPGEQVQKEIERNLESADLLLLLDTPKASESYWMDIEVKAANGNLIPIFPILFKEPKERVLCSRFRTLESLQRGHVVSGGGVPHLSPTSLSLLLAEIEEYLMEIFQRRLRIPFQVRQYFDAFQYDWCQRDRFIYESLRRGGGRIRTRIFSHCSYFDGIYDQALLAYVSHLKNVSPAANYSLYIYDGQLIPPVQLQQIERAASITENSQVILLHHQEVQALLSNNFASL